MCKRLFQNYDQSSENILQIECNRKAGFLRQTSTDLKRHFSTGRLQWADFNFKIIIKILKASSEFKLVIKISTSKLWRYPPNSIWQKGRLQRADLNGQTSMGRFEFKNYNQYSEGVLQIQNGDQNLTFKSILSKYA